MEPEAGPPVNYDEAAVGPFAPPPPIAAGDDPVRRRRELLDLFADTLYGVSPPPPDDLSIARRPLPRGLPGVVAEEITLTLERQGRRLVRRLGFWRPATATAPIPVAAGLAFLGVAGASPDPAWTVEPDARVDGFEAVGAVAGRLTEATRGRHAGRSPIDLICGAGWGLLLSGYGEWVPDHPDHWRDAGLWPFLEPRDGPARPGAVTLWAWALARLLDVLERLPEADPARLALFGHSRLGKAALWAAANDERVFRVLVNNSGCGGAKPSRRNYGETLAHLTLRYPHWLTPAARAWAARPDDLPVDQHQLLACVAPRGLHVASAAEDRWADPAGEHLSLRAALPMWRAWGRTFPPPPSIADSMIPGASWRAGPVAWSLRPGGHDLTPWDWARFLDPPPRGR